MEPVFRHVLVIDNEPHARLLVAEMLRPAPDLRVHLAEDGYAGLRKAQNLRPDLILLDVIMPILSGLDVLRDLRADPRTAAIPIVAVTALGTIGGCADLIAEGFDDCLPKPYTLAQLQAVVQKWLGRGSR